MTPDELADHEATELPDREALSVMTPGPVMGGLPPVDTTQPLPPEAGGGTTDPITLPSIPLPADNPGGTYNPDASASSQT